MGRKDKHKQYGVYLITISHICTALIFTECLAQFGTRFCFVFQMWYFLKLNCVSFEKCVVEQLFIDWTKCVIKQLEFITHLANV